MVEKERIRDSINKLIIAVKTTVPEGIGFGKKEVVHLLEKFRDKLIEKGAI